MLLSIEQLDSVNWFTFGAQISKYKYSEKLFKKYYLGHTPAKRNSYKIHSLSRCLWLSKILGQAKVVVML
jgi:hypothetical protein